MTTNRLRADMAELAEEVVPVDLYDRVLKASRRLGIQRTLIGLTTAVALLAAASGVAVAVLPMGEAPPPSAIFPSAPDAATPSVEPSPSSSASSSPSPSPSPSPSQRGAAGVPIVAMLQPADIGDGYRVTSDERVDGDWTIWASTIYCNEQHGLSTTFLSERDRSFGTGQRGVGLTQRTNRFHPGDAVRYLADVRAAVDGCDGTPGGDAGLTIVAEGFAGAESLLISLDVEGHRALHVLVRQGDLVTEMSMTPTPADQEAVAVGQRAAERLCAATEC